MAITDYNTNPDLNVSISGIDIAEGCAPSGINNAIRQIMADVANGEFGGATLSAPGTIGLVPAPSAGDNGKFLQGDGTWVAPSGIDVIATGTTTGRSLARRFSDVINVLDFGANGNGTTITNSPILAAIQASKDATGEIEDVDGNKMLRTPIFFPRGTYKISSATILPYMHSFIGNGAKLLYNGQEYWIGEAVRGTLYVGNDDKMESETIPGKYKPVVPQDGLVNIANGQLRFWPDLDGDGDYDADICATGNMYLRAMSATHLILGTAIDGVTSTGRIVFRSRTIAAWSALKEYEEGDIVQGSDGDYYQAIDDTGPEQTAGAVDPVYDTGHAHWAAYTPTPEEIAGDILVQGAVGYAKTFGSKKIIFTPYRASTPILTIDPSTKRVGVGTNAPSTNLHVNSTSAAQEIMRVSNVNASTLRIAMLDKNTTPATPVTIGTAGDTFVVRLAGSTALTVAGGYMLPGGTQTMDLGSGSHEWNNVYGVTPHWSGSDERMKDNIADPSEALMRAWGKVNFKVFQFRSAIAEKGAEKARIHVGVIAQQVVAAFESEGLDAMRYGLIGHDVTDDGDSYRIRYEEALALECAYQRWRLDRLEAAMNA